ncbi:GHMP kinase [Stygiolobus caldivivus]|uniref:phosphomevalonate kinase n=1 Tax=Stygiolobus caldivivus TaxID=2824673 RepID=A0A8D5U752_9CREN|nr:GHMP kinase [Stygiolobus caldivivus]BCU70208.1 GHMP kinase [Stygiolobus caldivivus]
MKEIKSVVSAPGKILWVGSYSVVFGGISHVISVDKRVHAECKLSTENTFETTYGVFRGRGNELIESVLNQFKKMYGEIPKFHVKLYNDDAFVINGKKSGLGSSSASTVALTSCIYSLLVGDINLDEVHKIAQRANYERQRGIGSGFDIASAVYGSIVYKRFTDIEKMDYYIKPLKLNKGIVIAFIGKSFDTVSSVSEFVKKKDDPRFKEVMESIEWENNFAITLIEKGKIEEAVEHVRLARKMLERLAEEIGVEVENQMTRRLEEIAEREGALIALSPGAGGESVVAIGDGLEGVKEEWSKIKGVTVIPLNEDEGLKIES